MDKTLYAILIKFGLLSLAIATVFTGCSKMMDSYNDRKIEPHIRVNPPIITPYLWIANSSSNTISQVDVETGQVLRVIDISGWGSNPSRTAVDYHFNCWVALRGQPDGIPDRVLRLDADTGDIMVGPQVGEVLRGIAINREGNIWVSASQPDYIINSGLIGRMLVDGDTMIPLNTFTDTIGSYGMAISPYNKLFSNGVGVTTMTRFHASTGVMEQRWQFNLSSLGGGMLYGIASDQEGNIWNAIWATPYVMGHQGNYQCPDGAVECARDMVEGILTIVDVRDTVVAAGGPPDVGGRGICVDIEGNIWAAFHPTTFTGSSYIVKIDKMTRQPVAAVEAGEVTVGVTADQNGNIWAVNQRGGGPNYVDHPCPDGIIGNGTMTRINTLDLSTLTFPTCGDYPYTYSDMAGFALRGVVMRNPEDPSGDISNLPNGVFAINNNLAYAFSEDVTLNISVMDADEMRFSNDSGVSWSAWGPYNDTSSWTLLSGYGVKTVLGEFRNSYGSIQLSDIIILRSETVLEDDEGAAGDMLGSTVSVSGDGNTIATTAVGSLYIYRRNSGVWNKTKIDSSDGTPFGEGVSVSANGNRVIVGAPSDNTNGNDMSGAAYEYSWDGSAWDESKIQPTSAVLDTDDQFGCSVAISPDGTSVLVGAEGDTVGGNDGQGSAFAFAWNEPGGTWDEVVQITAMNGDENDRFGCSVSISSAGGTVVIGAENDDDNGSNAGAVYVYLWDGFGYTETKLTALDGSAGDHFGECLSVSSAGDHVLVGTSYDDSGRGSAYLYDFNGAVWTEHKFTASDRVLGDQFGFSVSVSTDGKTVAVGAPHNNANRGSVYVYTSVDYYWKENQFASSVDEFGARFGNSLSISSDGNVIVVGAPNSDVDGDTDRGLIYVY